MKYYLYKHISKTDNQVFYVGKGTFNPKWDSNKLQRAASKRHRNKEWLERAIEGYYIEIFEESDDLNYILQKENEAIQLCENCVNKQLNTLFDNYVMTRISDDYALLNIFSKTYLLFSTGRIMNSYGKDISPTNNGYGYLICCFSNGSENKVKNFYVHRLIAEAFLPNPNDYAVVNHMDGDKQNNDVSNLEWTTQQKNIEHGFIRTKEIRTASRKKVLQFSKKGEFLKEWDHTRDIAKSFNCTEELIQQACSQKNKNWTAMKYLWIYKIDYDNNNRQKLEKLLEKYGKSKEAN